ncbi:hypothetical protein M2323_004510 [Rhodoblastus acidophilus]|uniref:hypothetical protein n=1 Tax=Rhodoblastus acidophilus TaxID=1074 RepID=UPI002223FD97|nr:hypothetical protein [Rhodoblastus acidophilus]MCW2286732.1 hypothetical protein [Rhodoblastus acidophilus]MCW2335561.1 hypothetical protein [Rhodoblastus acidophilus]
MGVWRKIIDAVSQDDGAASMYSALIGVPLTFDPPPGAKPIHDKPPHPSRPSQATRK